MAARRKSDPTRAWHLIERGFCAGKAAEDVNGNEVWPESPDAVAWGAWGAIYKTYFTNRSYERALGRLQGRVGRREDLSDWSDRVGKEVTLKVMKELDI